MPISISMIVVGADLVVAVGDRVPAFDISRSCKLDLAATAGLSVDQSLKNCVNDENRARQQLMRPVVQVLSLQQGTMHSAGKRWWHTKLREPFDMLADEIMVPMTESRNSGRLHAAPFELCWLKVNWPTYFDRALEYRPIPYYAN